MKISYIIYILIACNLVSFSLFAIDKYKAVKNKWRISEKVLILSAYTMGSIGALLGMFICRHKTRKTKFIILIPFALFFDSTLLLILWWRLIR
jgi:uncharacterized membrane protein YsdA (DUF1294 family)